jgi:gamma-glutamyl-gamma-aminobutyrate hydrolase PuuD
MANSPPTIRIGIYGQDCSWGNERHGCGLWPAGLSASVTAADAIPFQLSDPAGRPWAELMQDIHGIVVAGHDGSPGKQAADAEALCLWCRKKNVPLLAIDHGLHWMNTAFGGTVYFDLPRDLPEALQHRHPPERGLRHAINIVPKTILADLYGEGEVVVNSEHRRAVHRLARGFKICASALDGAIEAIESETNWFALGVQWQPASSTASGLDIQLFRGLVDACMKRSTGMVPACDAA